ncbi:MAG: PKD domain-containing protein [Bacteroidetes bacterium]|nr:PKD domain-containing protein [Bacteroidota bacterium]
MKKIILIVTFYFAFLGFGKAQTSILIYSEDFEGSTSGIYMNTTGTEIPGTNTGINKWKINNSYTGTPLYPNTPGEDQTESGNISFAPYSKYLHIEDEAAESSDGISNCNYNPTVASDRFVQFGPGFCTLGITDVIFTFFYICEGSPGAYAEVYYSADNGPWTSIGTYSNQMMWKNVTFHDAAFDNIVNLKFGIRWVNNSGSLPGKMSFGIDDVYLKGNFDNSSVGFNVILDTVAPTPVCQNYAVNVFFHMPVPICGSGFYEVELSDATGNFSNPISLGINQISNLQSNSVLSTTIPSNTPPGTCYKIRIKYSYSFYGLNFYTNASACFEVLNCPNTVETQMPVICNDDTVCIGSVILVPFFSTGVFLPGNNYYAELSDSTGTFSSNLNVFGSSPDNATYDPDIVPGPGTVGGLVNEDNQPIPDGCNYYLRVSSTSPATIGQVVYGPFCLKHCDIETNKKQSIQACISSTQGFDTTITIDMNHFDSTTTAAVYDASNHFLLEILDPAYFMTVNIGVLGDVTATSDTTMQIHIPPVQDLASLGLAPGMYYARIVATSSSHSYDLLGTLIFLTIGAPADNLTIWQSPPDSVLCTNTAVYFYPIPYNAGMPMFSTYEWYLNGNLFSTDAAIGILFYGAGTYNLTVQETNFGCQGPVTPNSTSLTVKGTPSANISGPSQACLGDTLHYQVPFQNSVYYEWTSEFGTVVDTSNNILNIRFDEEGIYTLKILCLNECGPANGSKNVVITQHPEASFSLLPDTLCSGEKATLAYTGTSTPVSYAWNFGGGTGAPGGNNPNQQAAWDSTGQHKVILTVTKYGCASKDSNYVYILETPRPYFSIPNQCFGNFTQFTDSSQGNVNSWLWYFGEDNESSDLVNPTHLYHNDGSYDVQLIVTALNGCFDTLKQNIIINKVPSSTFSFKSPFCHDATSPIAYTGSGTSNANFLWNFNGANIISGSGIGPYEISWSDIGIYNVELTVTENGCNSKTIEPITMEACEIVAPNVITPGNKDSKNDFFFMKGLESYPNSKLQIFNRWGKKVYESEDYKNDWDAENNSDGVYYWVLTLKTGTSMKGIVNVLR